ncbi:MAG: DegV family protein [Lachnospiraceae bacterium]
MDYKIVLDSCGELPEKLKKDERFAHVPLTLQVGEDFIIDDESFDQAEFLRKVAACPECPKSACPSPDIYTATMRGNQETYVVTLSAELSGSYNSAELGKQLFEEEDTDAKVHVFNSKGASVTQTQIALEIEDCKKKGMVFEQVVEHVERFLADMDTYFVLETLEMLRKNGRLSNAKALVASVLNIKPIMGSTKEGTIQQLDQTRGINKALHKMVEIIRKAKPDSENRRLAISHCNCLERALYLRDEMLKVMKFKEVLILDTAGVASLYAADGGIIVAL